LNFQKPLSKHAGVLNEFANATDFDLVQSCLEGDEEAIRRLQATFGEPAVGFLVRSGASSEEAREIVQMVLTDCLTPRAERDTPLASYNGRCALASWLNTVALNRLISFRRSEQRRSQRERRHIDEDPTISIGTGSSGEKVLATEERTVEAPLLELMRTALEAAFAQLPPEQFVMLQLSHADGLRQHELGAMFGCGAPTVSRAIERALQQVRADTLAHIRKRDPWLHLQWDDFLALCRSATPTCLGVD
jgi:RNA polymerase sigma factor (sigma-70 family)